MATSQDHKRILDDDKGNIWFGTVKGVIKYNPKYDQGHNHLPLVKIARMKVNLDEFDLNKKAEFTYKEKSFYFDFKGIYLTNPSSVRYKYILEGVDERWSEATNLTFANYPALQEPL